MPAPARAMLSRAWSRSCERPHPEDAQRQDAAADVGEGQVIAGRETRLEQQLSMIPNAAASTTSRVILPLWLASALPVVRLMCSEVIAVPFSGDGGVIFACIVGLHR